MHHGERVWENLMKSVLSELAVRLQSREILRESAGAFMAKRTDVHITCVIRNGKNPTLPEQLWRCSRDGSQ